MKKMTVNQLVGQVARRVAELADLKMGELRSDYPEATETRGELLQMCKQLRLTRGQMIEAIMIEEFCVEFDVDIPEYKV